MKGRVVAEAALIMTDDDTAATALDDLEAGRTLTIDGRELALAEAVPFGHKFALRPIDAGDPVYKYGEVIGRATQPIDAGEWIHTHNLESTRGRGDLAGGAEA